MPRRRSRFSQRASKPPKVKVPKVKVKKPSPKELKGIYTSLLTVVAEVRIAKLLEALQWYDNAILVYMQLGALNADQVKTFDKAAKAKAIGLSTDILGEKEQAIRRAILLYESLWAAKYSLPKIDEFYKKLDAEKSKLEAKAQKMNSRFEDLLVTLNQCFAPAGLTYMVHPSKTPQQFDGTNKILLNDVFAKELMQTIKVQGVLPVLIRQVQTVATALGVETDSSGGYGLNMEKYYQAVPTVLENLMKGIGTVPRHKLYKSLDPVLQPQAKTQSGTATAKPKVKRAAPGTPVEKIDGLFRINTPLASLYQEFQKRKKMSKKDAIEFLIKAGAAKPKTMFREFVKVGTGANKWTVDPKGTVTMV